MRCVCGAVNAAALCDPAHKVIFRTKFVPHFLAACDATLLAAAESAMPIFPFRNG
jgi:hypothetical protein